MQLNESQNPVPEGVKHFPGGGGVQLFQGGGGLQLLCYG